MMMRRQKRQRERMFDNIIRGAIFSGDCVRMRGYRDISIFDTYEEGESFYYDWQ